MITQPELVPRHGLRRRLRSGDRSFRMCGPFSLPASPPIPLYLGAHVPELTALLGQCRGLSAILAGWCHLL